LLSENLQRCVQDLIGAGLGASLPAGGRC
jgi:hypothetical protein